MPDEYTYRDYAGNVLVIGDKVSDGAEEFGIITKIIDPDGDVDDEGKHFMIGPYIVVKWSDEETHKYQCSIDYKGFYDGFFRCDELNKVTS